MNLAESIESEVRSYSRAYPVTFRKSQDSTMVDIHGKEYIDLLAGCGSLNYGHNNEALRSALLDYIREYGITMSMDIQTEARERFIESFHRHVLKPRDIGYKLQFTGPTGANAVEAAVKIARKVTSRFTVVAFTNGFHGCSVGALALTGSSYHRGTSVPLLTNVVRMPYDGYFGEASDTAEMLDKMLSDPSSGIDRPAAVIVETIQGEGGLNAASASWMQKLQSIARTHGMLLIVDDIQAGCGRTGDFFSFESLGISPDIVCLAKSLSGYGLPMAMVLLKEEHDLWRPGEHNGTFRGTNYSFVTAEAALDTYWKDDEFSTAVKLKADRFRTDLRVLSERYGLAVKGRGMMLGLDFRTSEDAAKVRTGCFESGLIVETSGPCDEVLKILPPLTIADDLWNRAVVILEGAIEDALD